VDRQGVVTRTTALPLYNEFRAFQQEHAVPFVQQNPLQVWGPRQVYHALQVKRGCCCWQECKVDQAVGAPTSEVLYVFDEANPIDPLSLASLIQVRQMKVCDDALNDPANVAFHAPCALRSVDDIADECSFAEGDRTTP
jgi:hypothetical protein